MLLRKIFKSGNTVSIKKLDRPLSFIHIPKTAGTAFENYLINNMRSFDVVAPPYMDDFSKIKLDDPTIRLYWGHMFYSEFSQYKPNAYYLTFIREPIARVISQYKSWHNPNNLKSDWAKTMQPERVEAFKFAHKASLNEFILSDIDVIKKQISNLQTHYLADENAATNLLASAQRNLTEKFCFFGIVERFQESIRIFRSLFSETGKYNLLLSHENRSVSQVVHLSEVAKQRVIELNQLDLQLYAYAEKIFQQKSAEKRWTLKNCGG